MVATFSIFNETELDVLRNLPEVLNTQGTSCTNFKASVPDSIKQKLQSSMGLDLSSVSDVPFRWIHGDTKPHVDRGQASFENTYLVYLTDGDGEFEVGEESYPITAGTGFVFSEGTSHAVKNTNGTSRLVLGPMSEAGFSVGGGTVIEASSMTDVIYISQEGATISYEVGNITNTLTFPVTIVNTDLLSILQVFFTTDITLTTVDDYFIIGSDRIQFGNPNLKQDGSKYMFTIDEVTSYPGLIDNSGSNSEISVYNIHIAAINGSTLAGGGSGWVGQYEYGIDGTDNYIINCSSDGPISGESGGIVGYKAGGEGGHLTIIGCSSSGNIGDYGGGITATSCGALGEVTIINCSSSGNIGQYGGGIVGSQAAQYGKCDITYSYSTGTIGANAGGIYGQVAGYANSTSGGSGATAVNCYSRGNMQSSSGGICGSLAAGADGTGGMIVNNCYSSGTGGNGIVGTDSRTAACLLDNVYSANGNWNDTTADAALDLVYYRSVGIDQPYELRNFGPSPYSLTTITSNTVRLNFNTTIQASSSVSPVIPGFTSYYILEISSDEDSPSSTVTINPITGIISTTRSTPLDVYLVEVYAEKDNGQYTSTTITITVIEPPPLATGGILIPGKGFNFETYNAIQLGNNLINHRVENKNLRFKSFEDYNKYLKSIAVKRR
jgi:hypothetical protein